MPALDHPAIIWHDMRDATAAEDAQQLDALVEIVRDVLGEKVVGLYLHGSTGAGRMRATSDLDVLVVVAEPTTEAERRALVMWIPEISGSPEPRGRWRPVELTVVRQDAVNPWHFPPERELQYGEWDRERYLAGYVPGPEPDPDLALLVAATLVADRPVAGRPRPSSVLAPVPPSDIRRAAAAGVPGLLEDLESDTRNVLLTLARIWFTLGTGEIHSKDEAAAWAVERLPSDAGARQALALAREQYLAGTHGQDAWATRMDGVRAAAQVLVAKISEP